MGKILKYKVVKQILSQALTRREKRNIAAPNRTPAAVLIPIYYKDGQHYIVFIKRTEKVKVHKGQISFPGGTFSREDKTLIDTARRESAEEIGLMPNDIEVLDELDDEVSQASNYIISPFVALIPWPYQFKVDGEETEEVIEVPISVLQDKGYQRQEIINGEAVTSYFYHYQGRVIWGTTARILKKFLDIFDQVTESK